MKTNRAFFAAIFAFLCVFYNSAQAVGVGGGIISGHPEYDFAWYTLDEDFNFTEPPFAQFMNGIMTLQPGAAGFAHPGISATFITLGNSSYPCTGSAVGTLQYVSGEMQNCYPGGLDKLVSNTAFAGLQSTVATVNSSLTTAVNSKVSVTTLSSYALNSVVNAADASITSTLTGKFAQPAGTTAQYLRGDGSVLTFPSIPAAMSFTFNVPSRSLNSAFQVAGTNAVDATYTVDVTVSSLLLGSAQGSVYLEYADNSGMTTNLVTPQSGSNSTSGLLNLTNIGTVTLHAMVPANKWVRLRTNVDSGTATFTLRKSQEMLF